MVVEFVDNDDEALGAARRLSKCSADECVSARELAVESGTDERELVGRLVKLEETDWVVMEYDRGPNPPTPETRWIVREHWSLTLGKRYEVLTIEADSYRLLDDKNGPFLFDKSGFRVLDDREPSFWISETDEDGERSCGPRQWHEVGFFEDYHDGVEAVRDEFWKDLRELYPVTWGESQEVS